MQRLNMRIESKDDFNKTSGMVKIPMCVCLVCCHVNHEICSGTSCFSDFEGKRLPVNATRLEVVLMYIFV